VTGRAPEEIETVWALTIAAEVLSICQDAGLPVKMAWSPFESHCIWYVLQVDRQQLRALNTNMDDFSNKVGHIVFGSKPGFYIPVIYLVGDDIDPTNLNDVIWANTTRCQPKVNEFFFDQYPNIALIPYVSHGVKANKNHFKVVRCCLFPSEFSNESLVWREASYRENYSQQIQAKIDEKWATYGF
jgi:4-hydroxy-3-polyprenylbenzoate decarboxylase